MHINIIDTYKYIHFANIHNIYIHNINMYTLYIHT